MSWTDLVPSWQKFSIEFIYATKIFSHSSSQNTISSNISCDSLWTGVLPVFLGHMDNIVHSSMTKITAEFILRSQRVGPPVCKKINRSWIPGKQNLQEKMDQDLQSCSYESYSMQNISGHLPWFAGRSLWFSRSWNNFLPILCIW